MKKSERLRDASDSAGGPADDAASAPREEALGDTALLERARAWWQAAEWAALCSIEHNAVSSHPQRGYLAALRSAAWLQSADKRRAHQEARQALAWGFPSDQLGQILIASARHTLARAAWLARREAQARSLFAQSLSMPTQSETPRLVQARIDQVARQCRNEQQGAAKLRRQGATVSVGPAWIVGLVTRCLAAPDMHDAIHRALVDELREADDRVLFLMLLAERMLAKDDRISAVHFLHSARWHVDGASPAVRGQLASKLAALGAAESALDLTVRTALDAATPSLTSAAADTLAAAYQRLRETSSRTTEHGHEVLLAYAKRHLQRLQQLAGGRRLALIEIGTTREDVPNQGSTRKLAEYCLGNGLDFVTVDMDPHNSRMARELFVRLGADFSAVTAKGEDYLRQRNEPIDLVFLDAYDFDHGQHSALRQSRYEKYLGSRIDDEACHRMHLDCAQTLASKLWTHGVVCIDDTWLDGARWTAKGTLAMPYLLDNGFAVIEARNRAALLGRGTPARP